MKWVFSGGVFGVGMRSTPLSALAVHHAWMSLRRVWFGVRSEFLERGCLVTGQLVLLPWNSHLSMLLRS